MEESDPQALRVKQVVSEWREVYQDKLATSYPQVRLRIEDVALDAKSTYKGHAVIVIAECGFGYNVKLSYYTIFLQDMMEETSPSVSQAEDPGFAVFALPVLRKVMGFIPGLERSQYRDTGLMVVPDVESLTEKPRIKEILTNALTHMRL